MVFNIGGVFRSFYIQFQELPKKRCRNERKQFSELIVSRKRSENRNFVMQILNK